MDELKNDLAVSSWGARVRIMAMLGHDPQALALYAWVNCVKQVREVVERVWRGKSSPEGLEAARDAMWNIIQGAATNGQQISVAQLEKYMFDPQYKSLQEAVSSLGAWIATTTSVAPSEQKQKEAAEAGSFEGVATLLHSLQLDQYLPAFQNQNISSVAMLKKLTDDELKELGVEALGHRKRLMAALNKSDK
eukprot:TRINITY_DN6154_c0_g1_i5.p1 TRINITY_DN6154_c0_g1~~TRINITY_DN6154_c0_g1_i5.p1  ORF type:complete len:192 (-),score=54.72 TRINITY_DN6154_c0_g1_i5:79-654(-)